MKNALLIFVRNPELGKVKTRLAAGIGDKKTLEVYKHLLLHTHSIVKHLPVTVFVYYADHVPENDLWNGFEKVQQNGNNLGERMKNAFNDLFLKGFNKVCIIGSDCYELTSDIIRDAFEQLNSTDLVIGPVQDGGYYLLGTKRLIPDLFIGKQWSTSTVFADSIKDAEKLSLSVHQLCILSDIDNIEDLQRSPLAFLV